MLSGERRPPKDKRKARFLFSSLQSHLFDQVLARRVDDGTYCRVLAGDLAKKEDSGGMFLVPGEGPDLLDAIARGDAGALSATGPMFGAKMRWPEGAVLELEREVLAASGLTDEALAAAKHLGEGTRRPLRIMAEGLTTRVEQDALVVGFVLPKGAYATTFLGGAAHLVEPEKTPLG
jgi:tRNA pseudouridine13 synthase